MIISIADQVYGVSKHLTFWMAVVKKNTKIIVVPLYNISDQCHPLMLNCIYYNSEKLVLVLGHTFQQKNICAIMGNANDSFASTSTNTAGDISGASPPVVASYPSSHNTNNPVSCSVNNTALYLVGTTLSHQCCSTTCDTHTSCPIDTTASRPVDTSLRPTALPRYSNAAASQTVYTNTMCTTTKQSASKSIFCHNLVLVSIVIFLCGLCFPRASIWRKPLLDIHQH